MKARIISGLCMIPLLIVVYFGGIFLKLLALAVTIPALYEFFTIHKKDNVYASFPIALASTILLYAINITRMDPIYYVLWLGIVFMACAFYLYNVDNRIIEDSTLTVFGIIYISFCMFHLAWLTDLGFYSKFVWIVVIAAFVTDIAAYFTGFCFKKVKGIGQWRLCPKISPKKTVVGAIGGIVFSAAASFAFGYFFTDGLWIHCIIMGIIGSIAGQMGDLFASIFKRKVDVKDYSNLIPGHGGIMDRIDSLLFVAPVIFWYVYLVLYK